MLRTRLTLRPGAPGTKKLVAEYGARLLCVRYRYDPERGLRWKTVELIIDEKPWPPPIRAPLEYVFVRFPAEDTTLRRAVRRLGGYESGAPNTWRITYAAARLLHIVDRIITHADPPTHTAAEPRPSKNREKK